MSLSDRLRSAQSESHPANRGCRSCEWFRNLPTDTQELINEWLDGGFSMLQLHTILVTKDEDSDYPPLPVSDTSWRNHARHHNERCRADQ
jgi:hypothetical protein